MNSPYKPGNNNKAPWLDDDTMWTKWTFHERYECRRCLCDTEVDEYYVCESCFQPEELTEIDYLDE